MIPPPVYGLAAAAAMWLIAEAFPGGRLEFAGQAAIATVLALAGATIDLASVARFLKAKTTVNPIRPEQSAALVTDGMYRFTRNPMYLGMALILSGWGIWLGHPAGVVALAGFVWIVTALQIKPEEQALAASFGDAYALYRSRVRRWI